MIKVVYGQKDGKYNYLKMKGHANSAVKGEDLICAGASSIIFGFMNALDDEENIIFKQLTNEIEIISENDSEKVQNYFELVLYQLKTIEESYSQYIKIERK